jgi:hypothetical protein
MFNASIVNYARDGSALSTTNQDKWQYIPGQLGIDIYWNHYMWNCSNIWEVVFKNEAPQFTKPSKPVVYLENDAYSNLNFTTRKDNATGVEESTVTATYNQWTTYQETAGDESVTPIWVVNQAALGTWYGANNAEPWKQYSTVLYNMVNMALGTDVQDAWCFEQMKIQYFQNTTGIQENLLPNLPPTQAVLDTILSDPYYGLYKVANYIRWQALAVVSQEDYFAWNKKLAW